MKMAKSRILLFALIASVLINIGIIGFVGAQMYRHSGLRADNTGLTFDRRAAFSSLEKEEKKLVFQIWKEKKGEFRQDLSQYRVAKRELSKLLSQDPLDWSQIDDAYDLMKQHRNKVEDKLFLVLSETAKRLPPEARKQFFWRGFKRWKDRHSHFNPHWDKDKHDRD